MASQKQETIMTRALMKKYNALAKKADRRMREIERFSRYEEFKDIKKYAYAKAEEMIKQWTPEGAKDKPPRWQRALPTNKVGVVDTRTIKSKIKDIESFLNMPSSTMTGVKKIYQKRAATLNKKYGLDYSWQDLAKFFEEGGLFEKTKDQYGSATFLFSIGKIQQAPDKALDQIQDFNSKIKFVDNEVLDDTINDLLKNHGTDIKALIS